MPPIYCKVAGAEAPATTHIVVAENGVFWRQRQWWVDASMEIDPASVPDLVMPEAKGELIYEEPGAQLLIPKLPALVLGQALRLAKAVCDDTKSEVCTLLYFKEGEYSLVVPKQTVSPAAINYQPLGMVDGAKCVGSIHSHGLLEAYHSETDEEDEGVGNDGVHITLGSLDAFPRFSFSAEIVVLGTRFELDSDLKWFEGLRKDGRLCRLECPQLDSWQVPSAWQENIAYHAPRRQRWT
jgi:PRTRC genetic system protein A